MSKHVVKISILFIIFSVITPSMANINSIENIELSTEDVYKKITLTGSEYFLVSSPIETVVATNRVKNFYKKNKNRVSKGLYKISLRDNQDQELFTIDIGNPFEIHAQHIGYEGQRSIGANNNANIEFYFPSSIDPSSIKIIKINAQEINNIQNISLYK
jgi:hypothetical protein|tara:strand:- start:119 stop:595 length:477 start_codon:yes stop_codon:yes gene_type:complete